MKSEHQKEYMRRYRAEHAEEIRQQRHEYKMANVEKIAAYGKRTRPVKKRQRRDFVIQFLGGKCNRCGAASKLEVDHIDANTKSFRVAWGLTGNLDRLVAELKKCQLLCTPCHKDKSRENGDYNRTRHVR